MTLKRVICIFLLCLISNVTVPLFANEPVAKEETTPPPAEGAIAVDQVPPIIVRAPTKAAFKQQNSDLAP